MEETKLLLDRGGKIYEGGKVCPPSCQLIIKFTLQTWIDALSGCVCHSCGARPLLQGFLVMTV